MDQVDFGSVELLNLKGKNIHVVGGKKGGKSNQAC